MILCSDFARQPIMRYPEKPEQVKPACFSMNQSIGDKSPLCKVDQRNQCRSLLGNHGIKALVVVM
jgi:hypothetical protein